LEEKKRKPGRPKGYKAKVPGSRRSGVRINLRATDEENEIIKEGAKKATMSKNEFMIDAAVAAAFKLRQHPKK